MMRHRDRRWLSASTPVKDAMRSSRMTIVSMTTVTLVAVLLQHTAVTATATATATASPPVTACRALPSCRSSAVSSFVAPNEQFLARMNRRSRAKRKAFMSNGNALRILQGRRSGRRSVSSRTATADDNGGGQESSVAAAERGGVDGVYDESWYLGDGAFAGRHLDDEKHIAAKKAKQDFFRERSLSVYDQMREASMLLLAQQQLLAAEEAREESSKPRFVAAAGGTQAARAQAARDRQRKRQETADLSARSPAIPENGREQPGTSAGEAGARAAVMVPTAPGMLSGKALGVGGLDEELEEIRRRVCVPLAAPADLLEDLGISPVRGLLLYGPPGCGKTLLARRLSAALTRRPPAVVSGPEILERFVGSSEANIRALFDYPPDVPGGNEAEQAEALHVIVMDEFDSIGQRRGGGDDGGDRVRDSVVNQLLARMDGFQELERPTLLVALTNRIDLLDSALLRPGRFEVQVQIPGPNLEGREAILRIHTRRMYEAGRISTPAPDAGATPSTGSATDELTAGYDSLMSSLAAVTEGFTGAELAGLVRAGASHSLERAIDGETAEGDGGRRSNANERAAACRVTAEDFGRGLADVFRSKPSTERSVGKVGPPETFGEQIIPDGSVEAAEWSPPSGQNGDTSKAGGETFESPLAAKSTTAAAAAVAAARIESDIGGSLSKEDLAAVQKLLLQKTSERAGEDALLFDAAQVVAQRRKKGRGAGNGRGKGPSDQNSGPNGARNDAENTGEGATDSSSGHPKLKKFEHTGWFHTYE